MSHPVHKANRTSPFGNLSREEFYHKHKVVHHESFMVNSRGMKIFTHSWQPAPSTAEPPLGVVAMIHGYAADSSWVFQLTAVAIAKLGFLVCALDLPGHGQSDGRRGHVPFISPVVDDCMQFFDSVRSNHIGLPAFLYGESFGGATAILVCLEQEGKWDGLVLNGAMCGISPAFKPPWPLETLLPTAAFIAPTCRRLVLTKSLTKRSFKEEWVRELVRRNPRGQKREGPPMSTALEMVRVCREIRRRCKELELPLLVVHGGEDRVCDSRSVELVYESAGSKDKTLKILPEMWHQLVGESEATTDLGFDIIFSWLKDRSSSSSAAAASYYKSRSN